jgi:Trk K+ transport system NAD-binding subunit
VLLRKQAPGLAITALVDSPSVREALHDLGVRQTVSSSQLLSRTLAAALETPHAGEMMAQLVGQRDTFAEVEAGSAAVGRPLSAVRSERLGLVLGLIRNGEFNLGLADDPVIEAGDRLLVAERASAASN